MRLLETVKLTIYLVATKNVPKIARKTCDENEFT